MNVQGDLFNRPPRAFAEMVRDLGPDGIIDGLRQGTVHLVAGPVRVVAEAWTAEDAQ